ncbi:hypothetical protein [Klebsiella pneumoniae IS39]|nr:hypothetical protein [Klebsiella pneumoniae IS39]
MSRGANSSGRIPPSAISECQPNWGISHDAENPPAAAPKVKPQKMTVIINERWRSGAYSDTSVPIFGIAAPSPRPVIKRKNIICSTLCEKAVAMVQKPKKKNAVDDDFLTSQPVGERAGENRPQREADQRGADHQTQLVVAYPPFQL